MNRKKICIFHLYLNAGGVERQLCYLANHLAINHDVRLLLCEKKGEFLNFIDNAVSIETLNTTYKIRLQLNIFTGLINSIRREQPDVLISFHPKLHWISILVAKLLGLKVFCRFAGYTGGGLRWPIHSFIFRMSDGLVAVSESVKKSMMKSFKLESSKIRIIENMVDTSRILEMADEALANQENKYFDGKNIIISIGRLAKGKRFDIILEALSNIRKEYSFVIIGDGPERENLEEKIHSLGLSDRVFMLGIKKNPYKFLIRASFLVLASSESEGFPNVILEALSLGIPCICPNYRGGTRGVISHKKSGYLVDANDSTDLKKAIDLFLSPESENMRNAISYFGKKWVEMKFNGESYVNKYLEYLK